MPLAKKSQQKVSDQKIEAEKSRLSEDYRTNGGGYVPSKEELSAMSKSNAQRYKR